MSLELHWAHLVASHRLVRKDRQTDRWQGELQTKEIKACSDQTQAEKALVRAQHLVPSVDPRPQAGARMVDQEMPCLWPLPIPGGLPAHPPTSLPAGGFGEEGGWGYCEMFCENVPKLKGTVYTPWLPCHQLKCEVVCFQRGTCSLHLQFSASQRSALHWGMLGCQRT